MDIVLKHVSWFNMYVHHQTWTDERGYLMVRVARIVYIVIVCLAIAALPTIALVSTVMYFRDSAARQLEDFKADTVAVGFVSTDPKWVSEDGGSILEAVVTIADCDVELQRTSGQKVVIDTVEGREIELYQVGNVIYKGHEYSTADYPAVMAETEIFMATPVNLRGYLAEGGTKRFPCFNAAA